MHGFQRTGRYHDNYLRHPVSVLCTGSHDQRDFDKIKRNDLNVIFSHYVNVPLAFYCVIFKPRCFSARLDCILLSFYEEGVIVLDHQSMLE